MNNSPPIPSPPPELVQQWRHSWLPSHGEFVDFIATQAAQWGADQELQACINFVYDNELCDPDFYNNLRTSRRPKPPTLKEQALDALREAESTGCLYVNGRSDLIRRALEALPND
jgi:hypothetical protein